MTPGRHHHAQRGTTLIEIMVVLALAALMMAVAIPTLSTVLGVDKRRASRELAATMRWAYEEATIRNQSMRIAYDLDHNTYWVEAADSEVRIHKDWRAREAFDEYLEEKQEADARVRERAASGTNAQQNLSELLAGFQGDDGSTPNAGGLLGGLLGGGGILPGARGGEYKVNRFQPLGEGMMGGRVELPNSVRFWGVWTPMFDEVQRPHDEFELEQIQQEPEPTYRILYTHVFPGGYMEDSVVYVSDQAGEDITSLVVEPLIGRVVVSEGEAEVPDTRDREER
ncbi:MAG: prepilin-type N-terminal cleavage/methylation domain-containing protein [Deltaproteobacteria bacterium]|nr:prepilin-type N-terminal cleavage/methylation domain-containing protein [Deltaproteobacteria bacterium]